MNFLRHTCLSVAFAASAIVSAQVEIDQAIELTGADGSRAVRNLEAPVDGTDAANKDYVDTSVSASGGGGLPTMITDESASTMSFGAAIRYCNDLVLDGHSDWRMPSYAELIHVLSTASVPNASSSNSIYFGGVFPIYGNFGYLTNGFRLSDGTYDITSNPSSPSAYRARCVR